MPTLISGSTGVNKITDGTIVDADVANVAASKLTGALPAISGASLTGLTSAQMPAGSVLQVVSVPFHTSYYNANSSSRTDITNFAATITPRSTSSKILVMVYASMNLHCDGRMGYARNGTQIFDNMLGTHRSLEADDQSTYAAQHLDSPNSASAVVYQIYTIVPGCANDVWINRSASGSTDNGRSGITLMEIAG